jgi:multidrug efflux pump subunit AcrB
LRDWVVPWVPLAGVVATIPLVAAGRTTPAIVVGFVSGVALVAALALARDHRARVLAVVAAMLFGTFAVYGAFGHGQEFFPEIDPREIWVDLEFPSGTNLEAQDLLMVELETLLADTPDSLDRIANVGSTGLSQDPGSAGGATNESRLTLRLARFHERGQPSTQTLEEVRERVGLRSEARVKVDKLEDGPPTGKAVSVRLMGDDYALLGEAARALRERMDRTPGLLNVADDYDAGLPEYTVRVDRVAAARANTDTRAIATEIRTALAGTEVAKFRDGEDEWEIVVRLPEDARRSSDRLEELTILDEDGRPIPLRSLVRIESSSGPAAIRRVDLRRTIVVDADVDYAAGFRDADRREAVGAALEGDLAPPPGITWEFGGADEFERESTEFLTQAFWVAILLIALILVTEFDSLITPVTILVAVVLSLIGVLWGLMLTGTPFGIIMTGIGVISLAGIVVNNAIVLCDFIFQERRKGRSRAEAIVEAGRVRMRPVLLTAVTTVLGLIPLTTGVNFDFRSLTLQLGSESTQWWGPMGVAVIFGLTVSTAFTLLVVPVTFDVLDGLSERFRDRRSRPV